MKVPQPAGWLGGLGVMPFLGLSVAMHFVDDTHRVFVAHNLLAYGAGILSFLGGVHWGLAIQSKASLTGVWFAARLILSVLPSIASWTALLATTPTGLLILGTAIAAILWVDLRIT